MLKRYNYKFNHIIRFNVYISDKLRLSTTFIIHLLLEPKIGNELFTALNVIENFTDRSKNKKQLKISDFFKK
jgi:hypothetical protein